MKWLLLSLFVAACNRGQYQNLSELRNELDTAKERLTSAHAHVINLEEEIAKREIAKIRMEVEQIQGEEPQQTSLTREERLAFFTEQREILAQIIKGNLSCSTDAQTVLNQILTYITEMGDTSSE